MTRAPGGFFGNRFVGASWRPDVDTAVLRRLRAATTGWSLTEGPGWLLASERGDAFADGGAVSVALSRKAAFDRQAAAFRTPQEVAAALQREGPSALSGMAPPFRAAWAERDAGRIHATTDVFGLGQLFVGAGEGVSVLSSSATLVADLLDAATAAERLAGFAIFGGFIGEETPFAGVDKLLAGARAALSGGRVEITGAGASPAAPGDLATAFREAVAAMLKAAPDAELELSGGLDSRMILAAMPAKARRGRRAITIGIADEPSEDVDVARRLAADQQLLWTALDAGGIARLDGADLRNLLAAATAAYDHMANPLDKAALIVAGQGRHVDARFGGQNGEILRGFYYPGQPLDAAPSENLARGLVSMRLEANDQVEDDVLAPHVRRELRASAEARMTRLLMSFDGTWGQVLDQFYLVQRMQNWVGNATGHRLMDHAPLYPFFDPAFVAAAMARPPAEKLNSRAAYRLLCDLDAALARRPLAGGITPASAVTGNRLSDLALDAKRAWGRIARGLKGRTRPTLGSQTVTQHWRRLNLEASLPLDRLARSGLFDEAALAAIADGTRLPSRPTLGFLLVMASLETRR